MAGRIGEAFVEVGARTGKFNTAMGRVQKRFKAVGASLARIGKRAAIGFGVALAAGIGLSIRAAVRQERAEAMLGAILKSTGNAAGLSAKQIKKHAAELQKLTGIGDEAIIEMQTMIATFKGIKGENFKRTTEAVMDMATVMTGGVATAESMRSAAIQLGKALNDPVANMGALSRVGIQFDEQTKKQIKSLTKQGKLFDAQSIILKEVESEFGGVTRAIGETAAGAFMKLKSAVGDAGEKIGTAILKGTDFKALLEKLTKSTTEWSSALETFSVLDWFSYQKMQFKLFRMEVDQSMDYFTHAIEAMKPKTPFEVVAMGVAPLGGGSLAVYIKRKITGENYLQGMLNDIATRYAGKRAGIEEEYRKGQVAANKKFLDDRSRMNTTAHQKDIKFFTNALSRMKYIWQAYLPEPISPTIGPLRSEEPKKKVEETSKKIASAETFAFSEAWKKLQQAAGEKKDKKQQLDLMKKQLKAQETTATVLIDMRAKPTSPIFATGGV